MNRRQFVVTLAVVAVTAVLGGLLAGWSTGRTASAQPKLEVRRDTGPSLRIDPQVLRKVAGMQFPELPPDPPLTVARGTLTETMYDPVSKAFSALLVQDNGDRIIVRTTGARMQQALQTAYAHDDQVIVEVAHQPTQATLAPIKGVYTALYVHMY